MHTYIYTCMHTYIHTYIHNIGSHDSVVRDSKSGGVEIFRVCLLGIKRNSVHPPTSSAGVEVEPEFLLGM